MKNLTVVVWMVTYNHEDFLEQAIKSIMMQQTNFSYKLFIGEDFSTDNTRIICENFKNIYPDKIELFLHKNNLGATDNGFFMFQQCFKSGAKYIAMCEGDDYWTDSLKLQKQVDVLEKNTDLVGCFHNTEERYWNDYSKASKLYVPYSSFKEVSIKDFTNYNIAPTSSVVFKAPIPKELFTNEFLQLPFGDWSLHLLNTRKGNYYYIPQVMSVRNLNPSSIWGLNEHKTNVKKTIVGIDKLIKSNWFDKEIIDLLHENRDNLEKSITSKTKSSSIFRYKNKIIDYIIFVLKKLK